MAKSRTVVSSGSNRSPEEVGQLSPEDKDRFVEIWKKAVETQMHFNEMSGKSRQLGLTFVAASLGVAIVMLSRHEDFYLTLMSWRIHMGILLIIAAIIALSGVRQLDLGVYHRMLRGAVTFGEDFEKNYMRQIFDLEKGMTQAISHYSRHNDAAVDKTGERYHYTGGDSVTAEKKIKSFYNYTTMFLILSAAALFIVTNFTNIASIFTCDCSQTEIQGEQSLSSSEGPAPNAENTTDQGGGSHATFAAGESG